MNTKDNKVQVTESDKIWDEIKDLPLDMFGLPNQTVQQHVQRFKVNAEGVFLKLRSTSVLTSLESALMKDARGLKLAQPKFEIVDAYGYTIVKRAEAPPVVSKK